MEEQKEERFEKETDTLRLNKCLNGRYTWGIKLLSLDVNKLEEVNNQMLEKFKDKPKQKRGKSD
jgi:hypothetical protein